MNKKIIKENFKKTKEILDTILEEDATEFSNWIYKKAKIKFVDKQENMLISTGGIYWAELGVNIGSEQNKLRPVIALRTYIDSNIVTVLPITSKRFSDIYKYHIDLTTIESTVLVEQIRTISKKRILSPYRKKGRLVYLNKADISSLNKCLRELFSFKE